MKTSSDPEISTSNPGLLGSCILAENLWHLPVDNVEYIRSDLSDDVRNLAEFSRIVGNPPSRVITGRGPKEKLTVPSSGDKTPTVFIDRDCAVGKT